MSVGAKPSRSNGLALDSAVAALPTGWTNNVASPPLQRDSAVHGAWSAHVLLIANMVLRSGVTLALMPLLIALMGEDQYALWVTISTVTMYLALSEAGLGQTVVNHIGEAYARGDLRRVGEVQATAHVMYWMLAIPAAAAALACLAWLPVDRWLLAEADAKNGPALIACLMAGAVLALARIPMLVFPGLLTGIRQLPLRLKCEMGATALAAVVTVLAAWLDAGLLGLTVVTNLTLLSAAAAVYLVTTRGRPWAKLRLGLFRPALLPVLAVNSGYFFLINASAVLDRSALVLLAAKLGSLTLVPPIFFLINVFRVAAWSLISAASRSVQPYVLMWRTHGDRQRIAVVAGLVTKLTSVGAALIVVGLTPFMESIFDAWLGRRSFPGMAPIVLISGCFLIEAVFLASVNLLIVMDAHRRLALLLTAKSLLAVGLAAIGGAAAPDGLTGLAAGAFAAAVIGNAALPRLACEAFGVDLRRYWTSYLLRPVMFCVSALASALAIALLPGHPLKIAALATVAPAAMAAAWILVLESHERQLCLQLWRRVRNRPLDGAMGHVNNLAG